MTDNITISKKRYLDLLNDSNKIKCLERGGVNNWDWFSDSIETYKEAIDCDEKGINIRYEDE